MIKNILLDLDDTIFDFAIAEDRALRKAFQDAGIEIDEELIKRYIEINLESWKKYEEGKLSISEVKTIRYKILFAERNIDYSPELMAKNFQHYLGQGYYYIDGAEKLVYDLEKKYNLYLVSNGTINVQRNRLQESGLDKVFKEIFLSEEIGYSKPNVKFFEYCFSKIPNFKKEETIIIGDSLNSDVKGGINASIKTIWFNLRNKASSDLIVPNYTIHSLSEVYGILDELNK